MHHLLDYLEEIPSLQERKTSGGLRGKMIAELTIDNQRFDFSQIMADVVDFVHRNLEEILGDVRRNP